LWGMRSWWVTNDLHQHRWKLGWSFDEATSWSQMNQVCKDAAPSLYVMGEERIMTNLKEFEPLPAYLSRVSLRWFLFFLWFPNGVYEFDDFPMLPSASGAWVYFILLPNEEDSINSVLVCNPSGNKIPALAWGEC
jgi:hypothetical protein